LSKKKFRQKFEQKTRKIAAKGAKKAAAMPVLDDDDDGKVPTSILARMWQFAALSAFLRAFGDALGVRQVPDGAALERAILAGTRDQAYVDLHLALLDALGRPRFASKRSLLNESRWHEYLQAVLQSRLDSLPSTDELVVALTSAMADYAHFEEEGEEEEDDDEKEENEEEEKDDDDEISVQYPFDLADDVPVQVRIMVLRQLCEWALDDCDAIRRKAASVDADDIRFEPAGEDSQGRLYWHFGDSRLYCLELPEDELERARQAKLFANASARAAPSGGAKLPKKKSSLQRLRAKFERERRAPKPSAEHVASLVEMLAAGNAMHKRRRRVANAEQQQRDEQQHQRRPRRSASAAAMKSMQRSSSALATARSTDDGVAQIVLDSDDDDESDIVEPRRSDAVLTFAYDPIEVAERLFWSIRCASADDWQELIDELDESEELLDRELGTTLRDDCLPGATAAFRVQRRAALTLMPRKRSSRLLRKQTAEQQVADERERRGRQLRSSRLQARQAAEEERAAAEQERSRASRLAARRARAAATATSGSGANKRSKRGRGAGKRAEAEPSDMLAGGGDQGSGNSSESGSGLNAPRQLVQAQSYIQQQQQQQQQMERQQTECHAGDDEASQNSFLAVHQQPSVDDKQERARQQALLEQQHEEQRQKQQHAFEQQQQFWHLQQRQQQLALQQQRQQNEVHSTLPSVLHTINGFDDAQPAGIAQSQPQSWPTGDGLFLSEPQQQQHQQQQQQQPPPPPKVDSAADTDHYFNNTESSHSNNKRTRESFDAESNAKKQRTLHPPMTTLPLPPAQMAYQQSLTMSPQQQQHQHILMLQQQQLQQQQQQQQHFPQTTSATMATADASGKGPYKCRRCGQPKKGHTCANPPSKAEQMQALREKANRKRIRQLARQRQSLAATGNDFGAVPVYTATPGNIDSPDAVGMLTQLSNGGGLINNPHHRHHHHQQQQQQYVPPQMYDYQQQQQQVQQHQLQLEQQRQQQYFAAAQFQQQQQQQQPNQSSEQQQQQQPHYF
jgi:hypothetical protein